MTAQAMQPTARTPAPPRETWQEQAASFVEFFIILLVLKTFFLPLFIIPTGSEAPTLYGAHTINTCPNCGTEYAIGWTEAEGSNVYYHPVVQCPNCRYREYCGSRTSLSPNRAPPDHWMTRPLRPMSGDRIFVNGWPFDDLFMYDKAGEPQRWDVTVFKVPTDGETNYIKRLVGCPNEKVEIVDGDIFVNDEICPKTPQAQTSLWFSYYNHDYPPRETSRSADYHPRWAAIGPPGAWSQLETRVPRYDGLNQPRGTIQFVTDPLDSTRPGLVQDIYGYNEPIPDRFLNIVTDVRLSAEIDLEQAGEGGYIELSTSRDERTFFARLYGDGRVELIDRWNRDGSDQVWGTYQIPNPTWPMRLALSHLDGVVAVEIDGQPVSTLRSTPEQYHITREMAIQASNRKQTPRIRIAAENVRATLRHLLIERDIFYTSDLRGSGQELHGVQGHPITLGPDEYFLLGDNSPSSQDARVAFARPGAPVAGPHLKTALENGTFKPGTVPGDQLIGPAFFVYWPGFLPLPGSPVNILPDLGRVRWIR